MSCDMRKGLRLLPPEALLKTGEVDHADWNFRPFLGAIMRMRYNLILPLLSGRRYHRLLEIGYGSGVFMPQLTRYCDELYGIDVHPNQAPVQETLSRFNISAHLFSGSAEAMPFDPEYFDCIVTASTLEFVEDLDAACEEIRRVLKPGGALIVVTPGYSPIVDLGVWALTGKNPRADYGDRRQSVIPTLSRHFTVQKERKMPPIGGNAIRLYTALELSLD